jgi:hypothetical protein
MTDSAIAFHWPSLLELNDDSALFPWLSEEDRCLYLFGDTVTTLPVIWAPLWHPQVILFLLLPKSTPSFAQSFKVLTNFSIFHTTLIRMKPANDVWYELRLSNRCLHTHRACRMDASFLNSSFATLATCASMQSTNATGSNATPSASFSLHSHQHTCTSSVHLMHWLTTLSTTSYVPFGNG